MEIALLSLGAVVLIALVIVTARMRRLYQALARVPGTSAGTAVDIAEIRELRSLVEQHRSLLEQEKQSHAKTIAEAEYERGVRDGAERLRHSLRYEREVFESKRSGLLKKEVVLKVRERILLENLRISEREEEVVLSSEVDQSVLWRTIDMAAGLLAEVPETQIVRRIAPDVVKALAAVPAKLRSAPETPKPE